MAGLQYPDQSGNAGPADANGLPTYPSIDRILAQGPQVGPPSAGPNSPQGPQGPQPGDVSVTADLAVEIHQGRLVVEANAFDLTAKLGFLLGAFSGRIESEIEAQLDRLLEGSETKSKARAKAKKPPS